MRGIPWIAKAATFAALLLAAAPSASAQEPDRYNPEYAYPDRTYDENQPLSSPEQTPTYEPMPEMDAYEIQDPVYDVRFRVTRVERATLNDILTAWTGKPREVADAMIAKYGEPHEASNGRLVWHNNGLWKITIVENAEIPHDWPMPHTDVVYQAIAYAVPLDKYDDLAMFDGSVIPERTRGWLAARCDKEEANFLAINLANDIAQNKRSVGDARDYYAKTVDAMKANSMNDEQRRYTSTFTFSTPKMNQGDRDKPHKAGGYDYGSTAGIDYSGPTYASTEEMERMEMKKARKKEFKRLHTHRLPWNLEWEWTLDHPHDMWKDKDDMDKEDMDEGGY